MKARLALKGNYISLTPCTLRPPSPGLPCSFGNLRLSLSNLEDPQHPACSLTCLRNTEISPGCTLLEALQSVSLALVHRKHHIHAPTIWDAPPQTDILIVLVGTKSLEAP